MTIDSTSIITALNNLSGVTHISENGGLTVRIPDNSGKTVHVAVDRLTGICTSDGQVVGTLPTSEISQALPNSIFPHNQKR
jgi:hypothetical protein